MYDYREILKRTFTESYNKLNAEQKKAVDTIEGPVMVIAGPGTGKTQILAARIGKILLETDVLPQNILCLTYTDAGAIAMRRRLFHFIGADAYKVNIYTFHSFCNDIIQDNLSMFEKTALNPVSELQKIQLFKELIDGFPKNHLLKRYRGDVYYEIKNLQNLFSAMKREGWSQDFLQQRIDVYLERIKTDEQFKYKNTRKGQWEKGDYKPLYEEEKLRMEKLCAAVNEFRHFQEMMRQKNLYDFDDMINWVIKAFEENKNLLANYQEKYQYILVDEYQDTSGTQNKIVELLVSYWENPNVFVVGDDDQSIFRFQGANIENMEGFANGYADLLKIVLTNNYRSTQGILDISKTLIERNNERLINKFEGLSKNLISSKEELMHLLHNPTIVEYKTTKDEMADITNAVQTLVQQGVEPGRISVIYKENKYGEDLARYFRLKDIPVFSKRSINIIQHPFAKKIILLLRYLAAEHDIPYGGDEMLFEILHYDFYKIPPIEIAKLTVEVNSKKHGGNLTSIRKLLYDKSNQPAVNLFDKGIHERLKNISKIIEELIADVSNVTLQQLFENIICNAGVLSYIMKSDEKIMLMQMLTALFDFIKEETARNPLLNLQALISIIDLMEKEELPLSMTKVSGSDKGVNLLTAHGSKGLEFEYVFVAGVNATLWEKKKKPSGGFKFPDTVFSSLPAANDDEELRRLFYVALTRAEKHLQVSYVKYKADGKELEPSMFIAEILQSHELPIERRDVGEDDLMDFEVLNFTCLAPEIEKSEEDFITGLLEKYVMNVTALNNYLKCPLEFYFKNLLRIPSGKSENTEFGSAVHFALQRLFEKMQKHANQQFGSKEDMIEDFNWYMLRHRENFTKAAFERRMEYGDEVLRNYYENYIHTFNKIVAVERAIKNVVVNGVPLKGKIDKLEFTGKEVNVVDYKTGDVTSKYTKEKMEQPHEHQPNGGDYWRQAVFYKILIDNYDKKEWKVVSTEFDFVEPDKKNVFRKIKVVIQPQDIETVMQQVITVWKKIQERDFYTGCGKEDCHWCNFVKDNKLEIALHEMQEEEV
ncbi:MAG: ATP-dependent helicase [Chitinophagaceae bacterium]|nr:ATP-dependent helicase [Chitinophagaceae bacterium]